MIAHGFLDHAGDDRDGFLRQHLTLAGPLLAGTPEQLTQALFIALATPAASMIAMLAQQNGGDHQFAAKGVAVSTLLSVITMPIVAVLLGLS